MGNIIKRQRRRNRHHILYPKKAWKEYGDLALRFRGFFIVKMNTNLHTALHQEIDPILGEGVNVTMLPDASTLLRLEEAHEMDKWLVRRMKPTEKIDWLLIHLENNKRNRWLKRMLRAQKRFLEEHKEEI